MSTLQVDQTSFIAAIRREAMEELARLLAEEERNCYDEQDLAKFQEDIAACDERARECARLAQLFRERAKQQTQENTNASDQSKT